MVRTAETLAFEFVRRKHLLQERTSAGLRGRSRVGGRFVLFDLGKGRSEGDIGCEILPTRVKFANRNTQCGCSPPRVSRSPRLSRRCPPIERR